MSTTQTATATNIGLNSTMQAGNSDPVLPDTGFMSEDLVTGSAAQIALDPDGLYNIANGNLFGGVTLFPNDINFNIGSMTVDTAGITGVGTETAAITGLDLSAFWADGSSTTDISDTGLANWFFGLPSAFTFGALDSSDEVTFVNGVLDSIDLEVTATFSQADGGGNIVNYGGTLSVVGDAIEVSIDDTQLFNLGPFGGFADVPSNVKLQLDGNVNAVGSFVIPEPTSLALLGLGGLTMLGRRKRA